MKKRIAFCLILFFFLQFSFLPFIFSSVKINLLLVLAFLLIRTRSDKFSENLLWLIACGFLFDIFSIYPFSIGILSFLVIGFLVDLFGRIISLDEKNFLPDIFLIFFTKLIFDIMFFVLSNISRIFGISWQALPFDMFSVNYLLEMAIFIIITSIFLALSFKRKKLRKNEIKLS